ncbi:ATP-binding cassette domain-containing protein [Spirillospora sp. NPDC047279]|uniref:ABC transporter ATP-binding protein n=1 Tax=Spirillospora sp. NPDC047279 TaxID=3155478 RepID=UPI0033EA0050
MSDDSQGGSAARPLKVDGVDVDLGGVRILRGVTFDVRPGEVFGIVGPNGAGKTTILNVIDGVVRPSAGTVRYGDVDLSRVRPHRMRDHGIGRSLQSTHYFRDLTALQLVALGELPNSVAGALRFRGHRKRREAEKAARHTAMDVLEQFGLTQYANRPLSELSSAVQKLVDIARAVVSGGELLLLDEPTSGVSGHERGAIGEALRRLRTLGRTIVLIDHDPGFVTGNCDRLMAMNFGEVLDVGLPDEVMNSDAVKRSYLGEAADIDVEVEKSS